MNLFEEGRKNMNASVFFIIFDILFGTLAFIFTTGDLLYRLTKILKKKSAESYSLVYCILAVFAYIVMLIFQIGMMYQNSINSHQWTYGYVQVMIIIDIISISMSLLAYTYIMYVIFISKKIKINFRKIDKIDIIIITVIILLSAVVIILSMYYQFITKMDNPMMLWLQILGTLLTIIIIVCNFPQLLRVLITRNTLTISFEAQICFLASSLCWLLFDGTQMILSKNNAMFPQLLEDCILVFIGIVILVIKINNMKKIKK